MTSNNVYIVSKRPTDLVHYCMPISDKTLATLAYKFTGNSYDEVHTAEAMLLVNDVQTGVGYNGKLVEIFMRGNVWN